VAACRNEGRRGNAERTPKLTNPSPASNQIYGRVGVGYASAADILAGRCGPPPLEPKAKPCSAVLSIPRRSMPSLVLLAEVRRRGCRDEIPLAIQGYDPVGYFLDCRPVWAGRRRWLRWRRYRISARGRSRLTSKMRKSGLDSADSAGGDRYVESAYRARFSDNSVRAFLTVRDRDQDPRPRSGAPAAPGLRSATHRQTVDSAFHRLVHPTPSDRSNADFYLKPSTRISYAATAAVRLHGACPRDSRTDVNYRRTSKVCVVQLQACR
jgi:hypothetical protein